MAAQLLGGYYHQDWDLDHPDPDTAVGRFLTASAPGTSAALVADLQRLRTDLATLNEEAALDFLVTALQCCYRPYGSNATVDAWLAHLQHLAAQA